MNVSVTVSGPCVSPTVRVSYQVSKQVAKTSTSCPTLTWTTLTDIFLSYLISKVNVKRFCALPMNRNYLTRVVWFRPYPVVGSRKEHLFDTIRIFSDTVWNGFKEGRLVRDSLSNGVWMVFVTRCLPASPLPFLRNQTKTTDRGFFSREDFSPRLHCLTLVKELQGLSSSYALPVSWDLNLTKWTWV